jgi:hypothetical protein
MGKNTILAVGGGGLSAAASLMALLGSPLGVVAAYVAPLPILLVGLAFGSNAAGIAASAGLVVVAAVGGGVAAGVYSGMHALPSWLVVHQALLRRSLSPGGAGDGWYPIGLLVAVMALLGAFVSSSTALAGGDGDGIEAAITSILEGVMEVAAPGLDASQQQMLVGSLAPVFVGFSALTWLAMILLNAVAAQAILARRGMAIRPTPKWSALSLPDWFGWVLAAVAAIGLLASGDAAYLARNAALVLSAPYFLVGLAVVHGMAHRGRSPGMLLVVFYLLLGVFFALAAAVVALIGMISAWSGWRPADGGASGGASGGAAGDSRLD